MTNESTIYIKNIKILMTEIYKFLDDLSLPNDESRFSKTRKLYSLRNPRSLVSNQKFTTTYGIDTIFLDDLKFGKIFLKILQPLTH